MLTIFNAILIVPSLKEIIIKNSKELQWSVKHAKSKQ